MSITLNIGERVIGDNCPVYIVAEISGNHNQDYGRAVEIVETAIDAGVDAIKLQTYTPDTLTIDSDKKWFKIGSNNTWSGQTLYELYKTAYTPWDWQPKLKELADKRGVHLFSSAFDESSVDFLETMGVPAYKVASFEMADIPLLIKIAKTHKPVIFSRGMAPLEDIELAIRTLRNNGSGSLAMLHCISSYPAKPEEMNLATIPDLKRRFGTVVGLSDHTLGTAVAIAGVAIGASIVEKHVTLRRQDGGPDAEFSLEPKELKELVMAIRTVEVAIGKPKFDPSYNEEKNRVFKRSIFVVEDIDVGETITSENVRIIRPGYGMPPKDLVKVLGRKAKVKIERGTPMSMHLIKPL